MSNERNHVVAPTQLLWGQRIYIVPFYHEGYGNGTTPNAVLSIAKQLVEAVAFLHENRIAHLDISPRNILLASAKELEKPRLLLTDFELATIFPEGVDPVVDIWDRAFTPPEGKKAINGFFFDIFCVGHAYASYFLHDYGLRKGYPNVTWPKAFLTLYNRMIDDQPEMRPTAREADQIMQKIDENEPIPYSGGLSTRCEIDFSVSTRLYPTLALDTPLPISRDFQAEEVDW
ncbi:negative regulator of the PHO system [Tulasnella sp. 408]|nr:negative regulator of the PHO system [Tulasnella sp. 408]